MFDAESKFELLNYLKKFITEHKRNIIEKILPYRTRHITVVLEDIYQSQNASAVIRTCDCFGVQDLHIIENRNEYTLNPDVALGADKWITRNHYNQPNTDNTTACIEQLKAKGYQIIATTPHKFSYTPETLPLDKPVALLFGTELNGLTTRALNVADHYLQIPMFGFTESFNISVSVAMVVNRLVTRLHQTDINWPLNPTDKLNLELKWVKSILGPKRAPLMEEQFFKQEKK